MTIIKEVTFTKTVTETLPTEETCGLRYAVIYDDRYVVALFDSRYWADVFVHRAEISGDFTIREIEA